MVATFDICHSKQKVIALHLKQGRLGMQVRSDKCENSKCRSHSVVKIKGKAESICFKGPGTWYLGGCIHHFGWHS